MNDLLDTAGYEIMIHVGKVIYSNSTQFYIKQGQIYNNN